MSYVSAGAPDAQLEPPFRRQFGEEHVEDRRWQFL
jgi:hypothetical protein